jgi:hypothetical protein
MPDMWVDVDTAVTVPVNVMPLTDDTDFKSREVAIVYNQAGMDLVWNFETAAGVKSQTAVTPTTSGDYDWSHTGDAMYGIEIPASGGASINNDTEGTGWFTGICTGVLSWRGPFIGFRAAGLNDALQDLAYSTTRGLAGTALPNAAAGAAGGLLTCTSANVLPTDSIVAGSIAANAIGASELAADAVTEIQSGLATASALGDVETTVAAINAKTTNLPSDPADQSLIIAATDAVMARLGAPAGASMSADIAAVKTQTAAIEVDTQDLQTQVGTDGNGLTAVPWNAAWDAEVQSECTDALNAYDPPTKAELDTAVDALPTAAENAAALMDLANGIETSITPRQAMRLILAASAGKLSGAATTTIVIRNVGDSKDRITATVDSSGNRSAVTVDAT